MTLNSLPDVAGMLVLMCVLVWLRNRHRDNRVDGWLLGLTFILLEMIAASVIHGSRLLPVLTHTVALDAYLFAAVTFGWAARRDLLPGKAHVSYFLLPSLPLLLLTTSFGLGVVTSKLYVAVAGFSVLFGLIYLGAIARLRRRLRILLLIIHGSMWLPMVYLAYAGSIRESVYWGLACMYLVVALSFRSRVRPDCIGAWVVMVSFVIWSLCFLSYPLAGAYPRVDQTIEQVWNMQKFFVVIGMLLLLLEDETQRRRDEAMHDPLTGLPNRRLFDDRLKVALERARRTGQFAAVFAIDLNGFKYVNDTYGHQMGDVVLKRVAERLARKVRGADTVARCGGDEFSVVVNDLVKPENCMRIADALRTAIEGVEVPGKPDVRLGGSIGYAVFPRDGLEGQTLCQVADMRMYGEKKLGSPETVPA
jgi:diguanylate cyclase (GGDEF)-like protein